LKLENNAARDARTLRKLRRAGWRVLTVWECQMKDIEKLELRLSRFLRPA
jgi:DNA mismatch endonuclease (patch repair protein)